MLQMTRYQQTRFWALWDDTELVAVVVYKKGATELLRRLAAQPLAEADAAAQAAAAARQLAEQLAAQARALARQAQAVAQAAQACAQPSG